MWHFRLRLLAYLTESKVVPEHGKKEYENMEVQLYAFLTLALDIPRRVVSFDDPVTIPPMKKVPVTH